MFKCLHRKTVVAVAFMVAVLLTILFWQVPSLQHPRIICTAIFCYFASLLIVSCALDSGRPPLDLFFTSSEKEEETTSDPPKYEDAVAQEIFGTVSQTTLSLEGGQNDVLNSDISFAYPEPPPPYHESVTTPLVDNEEDSGTM